MHAARDFLQRAFGFRERRESRLEHPLGMLTWLEFGDGVVMISEDGPTRHELYSQLTTGMTGVMINVYVTDIDAHYQRAVREGARVVLELSDTFWGDRRYEALDLEGHRWHFAQPRTREDNG
jgi:PhnB protein